MFQVETPAVKVITCKIIPKIQQQQHKQHNYSFARKKKQNKQPQIQFQLRPRLVLMKSLAYVSCLIHHNTLTLCEA